jgi:23S rRNA (cytosine1962-C5)-methyltransferase
MSWPVLRLKSGADRRLRGGHLWIYSNEVDTGKTPMNEFSAGQQLTVLAANGKPIGSAIVNPHQLICARLYSRQADQALGCSLLKKRLSRAASLRDQVFSKPFYRLAFGDSDGLPGLVIDRFGSTLVIQISSAGMELLIDEIVQILEELFEPDVLVLKNDGKMRQQEGLESYVNVIKGSVPDSGLVSLEENDTRFDAPVLTGQKTGWFYDHRLNRARMMDYAKGARVLDVFSYIGGWGLQALKAGATSLTCLDASEQALDLVEHNARLNGFSQPVETLQGDAFEGMRQLRDERQSFDLIIVDPPALIPRRKDIRTGEQAYQRLNELAIRLLSEDGILVSASCSMHLARPRLTDILRTASRKIDRQCQILEQGGQGPDHPIHPAIVEMDYIKSVIARIGKTTF